MESRKYQLQKQIIEALKANDNDLYTLLKSQWAHRFGVESLEELKSLDLNQYSTDEEYQKIDQLLENSSEADKAIYMKENNSEGKEIKDKEIESLIEKKSQDFEIKSYEIVDKENNENKAINPVKENKIQPEIKALIPLPPKPKYSYLKKWLLKK